METSDALDLQKDVFKLPASRKRKVAQAKQELRRLFGKER